MNNNNTHNASEDREKAIEQLVATFNYRVINRDVMVDTKQCCETIPELIQAITSSVDKQYMVAAEENIDQPVAVQSQTRYIVSGKRSFEAAKGYAGKKVAVLNYANNHSIGGAPFSAGAQEESLCRCSTLYPCLQVMEQPFYRKHQEMFMKGLLNNIGNDDLIYTPDVIVFKTDERTDPNYPQLMEMEQWYNVNVITCAAPEFRRTPSLPADYEAIIRSRIKKILDVAAKENNEVLILGAWGCGAFRNPIDIVSRIFVEQLQNYNFETVEFALATRSDVSANPFALALQQQNQPYTIG